MTQQSTMIEWVAPSLLKEHPLNQGIYGDDSVDDLVTSIKELGIIQPLHATSANVVISGHRRLRAAKAIGLPDVPVIRVNYADDLEERRKLLEYNRYRQKHGGQLYAEGLEYEHIEAELAKRRQVATQNNDAGRAVKELIPEQDKGQTRDKVADDLGIGSGKQWDKLKDIGAQAKAGNEVAIKILPQINRGITIGTAAKKIKDASKREAKDKQVITASTSATCQLSHGSFITLSDSIPNDSIDVIITDPPYDESVIGLCFELGRIASRILKPGGSLVAMVGQYRLPEVMQELSKSMSYHWTLAYLTPGGQSPQIWPRKINTFWKPLLWYTKGEYTGEWHGDVIKSDDNDKRFHHWGQSESGMGRIIDAFSIAGDTVLDPFMGAGTTGLVALDSGRNFIGFEIADVAFGTATERLGAYARG